MAIKDIHVALPEELIARLGCLARELGTSRNLLVRDALDDYLRRKELERLDRELDEYVQKMAPYSGEFVAERGQDVDDMILGSTEW